MFPPPRGPARLLRETPAGATDTFLPSTLAMGELLLGSSRGAPVHQLSCLQGPVLSVETGHEQELKLESEVWGKVVVSRKLVNGALHIAQ